MLFPSDIAPQLNAFQWLYQLTLRLIETFNVLIKCFDLVTPFPYHDHVLLFCLSSIK